MNIQKLLYVMIFHHLLIAVLVKYSAQNSSSHIIPYENDPKH